MTNLRTSVCVAALWVGALLPASAQPAPADLSQRIEKFDRYVESSRQAWGTPGLAVALVADGKLIWSKGYGVRQVGSNQPVTADTIFQIGSVSKSFTSALVAIQVDRGKLSWKERVIDRFPDFRMFDPWVTREFRVEDTMAQRSGQPGYATDALAFLGYSRAEIIQALRQVQPVSSFRSEFAYVNNLWLVAAQVVQSVTGLSWEQSIAGDIFSPLGMTHSSTGSQGLFGSPNHATPHQHGAGSAVPLPASWPFSEWVYTYGPAGGINSNVQDMSEYVLMQLGDKPLISEASRLKLHSPHIFAGGMTREKPRAIFEVGPTSYCQGWLRQELSPYPLIWHNGGTSGCKTVVGFVPGADIGIVVLSNLGDTDLPESLMYRFYDLYLGRPDYDYSSAFLEHRSQNVPPRPQRPAAPRPPAALQKYAGSYRHPVYGVARVQPSGSGLQLALGSKVKVQLTPWDGDQFAMPDFLNPADAHDFARFQADPDGSFGSLRLGPFSDLNEGEFRRIPEPGNSLSK